MFLLIFILLVIIISIFCQKIDIDHILICISMINDLVLNSTIKVKLIKIINYKQADLINFKWL